MVKMAFINETKPPIMSARFFLTGAQGCIGAWVVRHVLEQGGSAVVYDLSTEPQRMRQVLNAEQLKKVEFVHGDVTDGAAVRTALEASGCGHVIHLAGLQVPFCKADPALGAAVNVVGTINLFEAALAVGLPRLVYASSAAVYDLAAGHDTVDETVTPQPATHYGVYKRANEGNAQVYWADQGFSSVGLRPLTVYGVARDQGLTSAPTKAMKAAVIGRPYTIPFSGRTDFLYAADAAAAFVEASLRAPEGAHVYNLHGESVAVEDVIAHIDANLPPERRGAIGCQGPAIPIAPCLDDRALRRDLPGLPATGLAEGVAATMNAFATLHRLEQLPLDDLEVGV